MNAGEGLLRVAKVIRWFSYIMLVISIIFSIKDSAFFILLIASPIFLLCISIAWIIEGFAAKK